MVQGMMIRVPLKIQAQKEKKMKLEGDEKYDDDVAREEGNGSNATLLRVGCLAFEKIHTSTFAFTYKLDVDVFECLSK